MIERFVNPSIKYTTTTLGSLPGAKLYFYTEGTSTPKIVYKDDQMAVAHDYPVEADPYGIFEPIFLNGTYRVELKDSAGTTQTGWPIDGVGGYPNLVDRDLTFVGTGHKILGDFSNSTVTNRVRVQTTTTNGDTIFDIIPSSGSNQSAFKAYNSPTTDAAQIEAGVTVAETYIASGKTGSASYMPFSLYVGGVQAMTVPTATSIPQFTQSIKLGNAAVTDPLVMDWYEEGTCTPTIIGDSTAGTATYSAIRGGSYTRRGNRVEGVMFAGWTAHTGTGNIAITGLPYTPSKNATCPVYFDAMTVGAGKQLSCIIVAASPQILFRACDVAGGAVSSLALDTVVTYLEITFSYEV